MARCTNCGETISDEHRFCEFCGLKVTESGGRISEQNRRYALQMIAKSVVNRSDTDIILSPLWAIAPFVISIASMALGFAIAFYWLAFPSASWMVSDWSGSEIELHSRVIFFVIWLCNLANALILTKLAYNLVWRQGEHFRREHGVVDAVTTMTLQTTGKRVDERLPARD